MTTDNSIINRAYNMFSAGRNWVKTNCPDVLSMGSTVIKVGVLAAGAFVIGCAVVTISTGSFPALTAAMLWEGSVELVMATINISSCVRLFQRFLSGDLEHNWKEIAGFVAALFVTNFIGLYIAEGFKDKIFNAAFKFAIAELGCVSNLVMGTQIFRAVKGVLFHEISFMDMIKKVATATLGIYSVSMGVNSICFDNELFSFAALRTITAGIVGGAMISALCAKMWQIIQGHQTTAAHS